VNIPTPDICIFHSPCADGFGAALAVKMRFPEADISFVPGVYGEAPPDVEGKHVVIVDISDDYDTRVALSYKAASILILDHHKTAMAALHRLPKEPDAGVGGDPWENFHTEGAGVCMSQGMPHIGARFDMERSGARMAWDFFHPHDSVPRMIAHIEDRDLWRFAIPNTREFQAYLFSLPYDFATWEQALRGADDPGAYPTMIAEGRAIERKHHKDIAELLPLVRTTMVVGGVEVPVA
jgi:hypothetical protein